MIWNSWVFTPCGEQASVSQRFLAQPLWRGINHYLAWEGTFHLLLQTDWVRKILLFVGEDQISGDLIWCTTKWQISIDITKKNPQKTQTKKTQTAKLKKLTSWPNSPSSPACLSLGQLPEARCWYGLEADPRVLCIGERLVSDCGRRRVPPSSPFEYMLKTSLCTNNTAAVISGI